MNTQQRETLPQVLRILFGGYEINRKQILNSLLVQSLQSQKEWRSFGNKSP